LSHTKLPASGVVHKNDKIQQKTAPAT